jgi:deoxyribonuclease-4
MTVAGRRIGAHLPLAAGMVRAVGRAHEIGATALQVFADNPSAWRRRDEPSDELPAFRARLAEYDIRPVAIHAAYLINLAGPEPDFWERSIGVLAAELSAAAGYGAGLVNVHAGSHRGSGLQAGIERLGEGIARAVAAAETSDPPTVVLENSAGGGWTVGASIEELARIAEAVAARGVPSRRLAFCLDTAHLWAAGHRIDRPEGVDELLAAFDRELGLDRLVLVHLNDSKAGAGSHADRHEHLGAGQIGEAGLSRLLRHPALDHVAFILETPGMDEGFDAVNLARARDMLAGRPLAPLPLGGAALVAAG